MKKRFLAVLVAIVMLLTAFAPRPNPTIEDVLDILMSLAGLPSTAQEGATIEDALEILMHLAGLPSVYCQLTIDNGQLTVAVTTTTVETTPPPTTTPHIKTDKPPTTTAQEPKSKEIDFRIVEYVRFARPVGFGWQAFSIARSLDELSEVITLNEREGYTDHNHGIDEDFFENNAVIVIYDGFPGHMPFAIIDSLIKYNNTATIRLEYVMPAGTDGVDSFFRTILAVKNTDLESINNLNLQREFYFWCQELIQNYVCFCPCIEIMSEANHRLDEYLKSVFFRQRQNWIWN